MYNKHKFNWHELFNNTSGKTSGSAFIGLYFGIIAGLAFIAGMIGWFMSMPFLLEIFEIILKLAGISVLLLGIRKVVENINKPKNPE